MLRIDLGAACVLRGPLCFMLVPGCVYTWVLFVYILKPVGVVCIYGGLVCPGHGGLYGNFVWCRCSDVYTWVQLARVHGDCVLRV